MDDEFPIRWESFHIDGTPAGVLARRLHPAGLDTLTWFRDPGGSPTHLEHSLWFTDDPRSWTRFRYRQVHDGSEVERVAEEGGATVPAYGEFVMLDQLELGSEVSYRAVLEGAPDDPPVEVLLRAVGSEEITTPDDNTIDCTRVEVTENGMRTNTHWLDSSGLRASDWNGATSWRVPGRDQLTGVPGLHDAIDGWLDTLASGVGAVGA